jgi:hypothetical protein
LAKPGGELWARTDIQLAEQHLLRALDAHLAPTGTRGNPMTGAPLPNVIR